MPGQVWPGQAWHDMAMYRARFQMEIHIHISCMWNLFASWSWNSCARCGNAVATAPAATATTHQHEHDGYRRVAVWVYVCTTVCVPMSLAGSVCESVWSEHRVKISEPQTVNSYRDKLQLLYASPTTSTNRVSKKDNNNNNESSGKVKMTIKPRQWRRWQTNECEHERTSVHVRTYYTCMYACSYMHTRTHGRT